MFDLLVFVAHQDTYEALVYGPGRFSARRDFDGVWTSPAPNMRVDELHDRFKRIDDAESAALLAEARAALADSTLNRPRATPAQLLAAAQDYNRRLKLADEAGHLAKRAIHRAAQQAKAPPGTLIFGTVAWGNEFAKQFNEKIRRRKKDSP